MNLPSLIYPMNVIFYCVNMNQHVEKNLMFSGSVKIFALVLCFSALYTLTVSRSMTA